jgi:hypothetical protein
MVSSNLTSKQKPKYRPGTQAGILTRNPGMPTGRTQSIGWERAGTIAVASMNAKSSFGIMLYV